MHVSQRDAEAQPQQLLVAGKLYTPDEIPGPVAVVLAGTTIRDIWHGTDAATAMDHLTLHMPDTNVKVTDSKIDIKVRTFQQAWEVK